MINLDTTLCALNSYDSFVKYHYINNCYNAKYSRCIYFHYLHLLHKLLRKYTLKARTEWMVSRYHNL